MNKIQRAFSQASTDKGYMHGYHRWYDRVFREFTPKSLLEVGIKHGNSLAAWRLAFPDCDITGLDITNKDFRRVYLDIANAKIIIGDSTQDSIVNKLNTNYDVIIDDGSHYYKHINKTFSILKNHFNYCYIIEDCMYRQDETIDLIKQQGFNNIRVYDSYQQFIPANKGWLETSDYVYPEELERVDLKLIVVYKY